MSTRFLATGHVQFIKYLVVGGVNTVGALAIIFLAQYLHANPILANFIGYSVGISVSFLLNSRFTFRISASERSAVRFAIVCGVSYLANLATVVLVSNLTSSKYWAQVCGIPVYTLVGFFGNKYWAMRPRNR